MEELKACPFCKEKNFKLYSIGQLETKMLQCQTVKCPLWGIAFRVEAWNTRHEPEVWVKGYADSLTPDLMKRLGEVIISEEPTRVKNIPVSIIKREE